MSRKVYVEVKAKLIIDMEEGIEVDDVLADMDYDFSYSNDKAEIVDSEILDWEITDSK